MPTPFPPRDVGDGATAEVPADLFSAEVYGGGTGGAEHLYVHGDSVKSERFSRITICSRTFQNQQVCEIDKNACSERPVNSTSLHAEIGWQRHRDGLHLVNEPGDGSPVKFLRNLAVHEDAPLLSLCPSNGPCVCY